MKKIMFSHRWGLHQAVLAELKSTTLRIIPEKTIEACKDPDNPFDTPDLAKLLAASPYKAGDIVAIAEPYKDIFSEEGALSEIRYSYGWNNKMYVKAELMPHRICITAVSIRELQSLTYEELVADGLYAFRDALARTHRNTNAGQGPPGRRALQHEFFSRTMGIDIHKDNPLAYRYSFCRCPTFIQITEP